MTLGVIINGTNGKDTLLGTGDDDKIYGFGGKDVLKGGGGHDILDGGSGADTMAGGTGDDDYYVDDKLDKVIEAAGEGHDTVHSTVSFTLGDNVEDLDFDYFAGAVNGIGNDLDNTMGGSKNDNILKGGGGDDKLYGEEGNDTLVGGADHDILFGGHGDDTMYGGTGDDWYSVWEPGDVVVENADEGHDWVWADFTYTLPDNVEDLSLGHGNINGTGNDLDNYLAGQEGDNVLIGGGGKDRLVGADGSDTLTGGTGADTFFFDKEVEVTAATADRITDFNAAEGDLIDLHYMDADVYAAGNQAFTFIGSAAFSGTPGEIRYYQSGGNTYIELQTGTSVDVEGVIRLDGLHTPDASWFVL